MSEHIPSTPAAEALRDEVRRLTAENARLRAAITEYAEALNEGGFYENPHDPPHSRLARAHSALLRIAGERP